LFSALSFRKNADGIRALFVLAHVFEIERLVVARFVLRSLFGVGDQVLAFLFLGSDSKRSITVASFGG
jgi:hypothetical protein